MPNDAYRQRCRQIAQDFLLTAVVVDDEPYVPGPRVPDRLIEPDRGAAKRALPSVDQPPSSTRPLHVVPVTWSFAKKGIVCGVLSPQSPQEDLNTLAEAVARADIVILDWLLDNAIGTTALPLLEQILSKDSQDRLRLIALYTGEPGHDAIREAIAEKLNGLESRSRAVPASDSHGPIEFGGCRIVVYAKQGSRIPESSAMVKEKDLADRLIDDFVDMVEGLLPSLVLTALTAVRENVYRVLGRFGRELDPAFLTHRACLPQPADSEQHIGEQIASELHGIIDDAIGRQSPAGIEAIKQWLKGRFGDDPVKFGDSQDKQMCQTEVVEMLTCGIEERPGPLKAGGKDYGILSAGFSGNTQAVGAEVDRRLASTMSFRQVLTKARRQLSMGTVIRQIGNEGTMLLCVTPKCDSIRLAKESSFLFLPLVTPKQRTPQVVVPVSDNKHERLTISLNPSKWCNKTFTPDPERACVLTIQNCGDPARHVFKAVDNVKYEWVGELKSDAAQSIAQEIAKRLSRIPLNRSEWLRRQER